MATYIIADIHGDLASFQKMMQIIQFNDEVDYLIVDGDVLDRGEHGIEILFRVKEMVEKGCALMIKGNHELFAQMYMEGLLSEKEWTRFYGEATLDSLKKLDEEKREELLGFIKSLPLYIERETPLHKATVITHTGLMDDYLVTKSDDGIDVIASIEKAAVKDEYSLLISADIHYWGREQLRRLDKFIICGHVPTYQLGPEYTGKVLETRAYLNIDAGAGYREQGGRLACYRCEDGKAFYI